jgi:hypothetical protein
MSKTPKPGSGDAATGKTPSGTTSGKSGIELVPVNLTVNGLKRFPADLNRRDSQRVRNERILVH